MGGGGPLRSAGSNLWISAQSSRGVVAPKGVHDAVDILLAEAVFRAVLPEALGGIDHEDAFADGGVLFIEHEDARRNARAIKEIRGQPDDCFEVAGTDELLTNHPLGIAPEEDAMRENAGGLSGPLHGKDDVQEIPVVSLFPGRHT